MPLVTVRTGIGHVKWHRLCLWPSRRMGVVGECVFCQNRAVRRAVCEEKTFPFGGSIPRQAASCQGTVDWHDTCVAQDVPCPPLEGALTTQGAAHRMEDRRRGYMAGSGIIGWRHAEISVRDFAEICTPRGKTCAAMLAPGRANCSPYPRWMLLEGSGAVQTDA